MKVTLSGANDFVLHATLAELVAGFVQEHGDIALERLDGEDATFERIQESLQSVPFLASKKMVVLRNPGVNKQFVEQAERLLAELPETTDVILVEPKLDRRSTYYKFLKKATDFRDCAPLDERGLAQWLVQRAKGQGGEISLGDATLLAERVGLDQQFLSGELDKLLLYAPKVTREAIELLTEPTPQSTVFELIEAAFAGNPKRAVALYRDQREQKVDPAQIIAMLAWQLRVLALIKAAGERSAQDIAREAKLNPFVVRKSQAVAGRLSMERLGRLIADLLRIDVRSKRENIDLDEALQLYLLELVVEWG